MLGVEWCHGEWVGAVYTEGSKWVYLRELRLQMEISFVFVAEEFLFASVSDFPLQSAFV